MRIISILLLSLLFIPCTAFSFDTMGIQPVSPNGIFSTFSAESLPRSSFSLEAGAEKSASPDFLRLVTKGAYGITDSLEVSLVVPYISIDDNADGFEDISFGLKKRFYDQGKYGPSVSLLVHASIDTGGEDFSTSGRYGAGLILTKRIGPFDGHVNVLYSKPVDNKLDDEIIFSGGVEFAASHNLKLLGEVIVKNSHFSDKYDLIETRLGYRVQATDYIFTTVGAGFDIKNRNPEFRFMLAVNFMFPHEKKQLRKIIEEEQ